MVRIYWTHVQTHSQNSNQIVFKNWVHSMLGTSQILGYVYSKFQVGRLSKNTLLNFEISQSNSPKARLQRSLIGRLESTKLDRQNLQFDQSSILHRWTTDLKFTVCNVLSCLGAKEKPAAGFIQHWKQCYITY